MTCSSNRSGTPAGRSSVGKLGAVARFDTLDSPLDFTDRVEVSVTVVRSRVPSDVCSSREVRHHRVEDALVSFRLRDPLLPRPPISEQTLEHDSRIVLGRQRRRVRAPGERVEIRAAVAVLTLSAQEVEIDRQLERGQRRGLSQMGCGDLIGRDAVAHIGALGPLAVHAGEPRARPARVIAVRAIVERIGLVLRQPADHEQPIAVGRERTEDRRQLEPGAFTGRRPVVDAREIPRDAIREIDEAEPAHGVRCGLRHRRQRRDHRVEQRKPECRPDAAKEGSTRKGSLRYEHGASTYPAFLMRNGGLCTMPATSDEKR